jgi:raffinose/stachyose/melibiose transport system substrate-binding protein
VIHHRKSGALGAVALVGAGLLALTACSSGSEGGGNADGEFTFLSSNQNTTIAGTLDALSGAGCTDAAEAASLVADEIDGTTFDQQLQILASQDALANMSMAPGAPSVMKELIDAGKVVDLSEAMDELGVSDAVLPAAEATLKALYDTDALYAVPTEYNIEGFWYNKELLESAGVEAPTTWDELADAAAALDAAGVQPFVSAGAGNDGWAVSRLIGNYILRDLGPDALQKVADGDAKLTDPEYVAGAEAVAELGAAGYFGAAPGSVDYNSAMSQFLTGGGAFFYMGSWAVSAFNDEAQNQIGLDNIGFFHFPDVEGGAGSVAEVPANAGQPAMFTTANYTDDTAAWVKCVLEGYGNTALNEFGQVTGFRVDEIPADQSELTTLVQEEIASAESSVLWFEAKFSAEATTVSQSNAGSVAAGSTSGADFMALVQAALDK